MAAPLPPGSAASEPPRIVGRTETQLREANHQLVKPTPQQLADWSQRVGKPVIDKWIELNPTGKQVLDTFQTLYANVKAGS